MRGAPPPEPSLAWPGGALRPRECALHRPAVLPRERPHPSAASTRPRRRSASTSISALPTTSYTTRSTAPARPRPGAWRQGGHAYPRRNIFTATPVAHLTRRLAAEGARRDAGHPQTVLQPCGRRQLSFSSARPCLRSAARIFGRTYLALPQGSPYSCHLLKSDQFFLHGHLRRRR